MKSSKSMNPYKVGTLLSIPCEIMQGAVSNEKFVKCDLGNNIVIEGAIPEGFTDVVNNRVIAVVYEFVQNMYRLYFNGDIFSPGNPVNVSKDIVDEKCEVVDFESKANN